MVDAIGRFLRLNLLCAVVDAMVNRLWGAGFMQLVLGILRLLVAVHGRFRLPDWSPAYQFVQQFPEIYELQIVV